MDEKNREIVLKVRLNKAEYDALVKMANAQGIGMAATVRSYIHRNYSK